MASGYGSETQGLPLTRAALESDLPAEERLLVDTSALLAYLTTAEPAHPIAALVIDEFVRPGRNSAVVSAVTAMEALIRPLRAEQAETYETIVHLLRNFPNLALREVDFDVAERAARLRARFDLPTPDALIVASGLASGARRLVTNDERWVRRSSDLGEGVIVHYLESYLPWP